MDILSISPSPASLTNQAASSVAARNTQTVGKAADTTKIAAEDKSVAASAEQLASAVAKVREFVKPVNSALEFSINDDPHQVVVKVVDVSTKEVIRQIPSEEMLAIAKTLDSIKGLFVKQTA